MRRLVDRKTVTLRVMLVVGSLWSCPSTFVWRMQLAVMESPLKNQPSVTPLGALYTSRLMAMSVLPGEPSTAVKLRRTQL